MRCAAGSLFALLSLAAGAAVALAAELAFDLRVEHGSVPEAMRLMRVHQGDVVRLRWTSDRALVLHLHFYDIARRVAAGLVSEFAFTASATGRFPIEIHASGTDAGGAHQGAPLAVIEVYPR